MMPEKNNHKDTLKLLYEDFQRIEPTDHTTREVVSSAMGQLERALADEIGEGVIDHNSMIDQLNDAALHLEAEHPTIAAAIRTAVNILTQLGL
jgi:hypothetical protein